MKRMIRRQLLSILVIVLFIFLLVNFTLQMLDLQSAMKKESDAIFSHIEQILATHSEDAATAIEIYKQTCLNNADAVAYIIQGNPSVLNNIEELRRIAKYLEIDEIHIFDANGVIVNGTVPDYYGLSMDSGEQISFFKPMLTNKNLKACQDITPNTAEGKQMQYSAVWSSDGSMIVQVGNEPTRVLEVTKRNELSYIFTHISVQTGSHLYAIDKNNATILGSTKPEQVGLSIFDIGIKNTSKLNKHGGFHATVNNELSYCVFKELDTVLILRACDCNILYRDILYYTVIIVIYLVAMGIFLLFSAVSYLDKNIIYSIKSINKKLKVITDGNFDAEVHVTNTSEFEELSTHINTMVDSILASTDKISYILDSVNIPMGVYEYNSGMPRVRATKHISDILHLSERQASVLLSDYELFENYITQIENNIIDGYDNIYYLDDNKENFVKIQHFEKDGNILGIITDVTKEMIKHKNLESERDIDVLTGLYNRRGLESRLDQLFKAPDKLGHSALIMLDADGLKIINDKYGHDAGDKYLKVIADVLRSINIPNKVLSRQGGDEFIIFFYGCETHEELVNYIDELKSLRDKQSVDVEAGNLVKIRYSLGYTFCYGNSASHYAMLREADDLMYEDKRIRKAER